MQNVCYQWLKKKLLDYYKNIYRRYRLEIYTIKGRKANNSLIIEKKLKI